MAEHEDSKERLRRTSRHDDAKKYNDDLDFSRHKRSSKLSGRDGGESRSYREHREPFSKTEESQNRSFYRSTRRSRSPVSRRRYDDARKYSDDSDDERRDKVQERHRPRKRANAMESDASDPHSKDDSRVSGLDRNESVVGKRKFERRVEEEVERRVEAEVQRRVEQLKKSPEFKKEIESRLEHERKKREAIMKAEIEFEKNRILEEFRRKEEEEKRSKQELEDVIAENERKVRAEQQRLADEQARADEMRLAELQRIQLAREEERRRKLQHEKTKDQIEKTQKQRQKLAFKMSTSPLGNPF